MKVKLGKIVAVLTQVLVATPIVISTIRPVVNAIKKSKSTAQKN